MDEEKDYQPVNFLDNPDIPLLKKLQRFGIKPGLERINFLLHLLKHPEKKFTSVLIGGTNGKGSVASMLYSILTHNGYKAGLYTSPHLISILERFRSTGGLISSEEFLSIGEDIIKKIGEEKLLKMGVTYFEFTTALAFQWFAEKKVDIAVLEVGMGGRLDATNSAPAVLSIITSVSKDHTDFLGKRIEEIAFEKAGIIKEDSHCVTSCRGKALRVIEEISKKRRSNLLVYGKHFHCTRKKDGTFDYHGINWNFRDLSLNLLGAHQVLNAGTALAGTEVLNKKYGFHLDAEKSKMALKNIPLFGRFEIIRKNPFVLLDGAHNPSAIMRLAATLKEAFPRSRYHIIFGAMADKDIRGMLKILERIAEDFYITAIPCERAENPENIKHLISKEKNALCFKDVQSAYRYALRKAEKRDVICITGSFYLVGEFIRCSPISLDLFSRVMDN